MSPREMIDELSRVSRLVKNAADRVSRLEASCQAALKSAEEKVAKSKDLLSMHDRVTWLLPRKKRHPFVVTDKLSAALLHTEYLIRRLQEEPPRRAG